MSSYKSKMSATEKEICFGHIQKHLNAQSTKSAHFSDSDSAPIAMSESSFKGQDIMTAVMQELSLGSDSGGPRTPDRPLTNAGNGIDLRSSFIRVGKSAHSRDPFMDSTPSDEFGSPCNRSMRRRAEREHDKWRASRSTPSTSDKIMKNWRVIEPTSDDSSPANAKRGLSNLRSSVPADVIVDKNNCQLYYPPDSCLFVANLNSQHDEVELEAAVTEVFRKYGTVYVKITRDKKNMPMGFVQFTNNSDAVRAKDMAKGSVIFGRGCRIEWSNANRNYHLTRHDGVEVTGEVARAVLGEFGEIERIHFPSETEIVIYNLGRGPLVTFLNYQSGREALNELRDSDEWNFQAKNNENTTSPFHSAKFGASRGALNAKAYLDNYDVDRRSVFVGNLPSHVTEAQVLELFGPFGHIVNITINRRPSIREGCDVNVFSYIEFANPVSAQDAIEKMHMHSYGGLRLKVDQKKPQDMIGTARRKSIPQRTPVSSTGATTMSPAYGPSYPYMGYPTPYSGGAYTGYAQYPYHVAPYCFTGSPGYVATPPCENISGHVNGGPPPLFTIPGSYGQAEFFAQGPMVPYAVQYGPQAHKFQNSAAANNSDGDVFTAAAATGGNAADAYEH